MNLYQQLENISDSNSLRVRQKEQREKEVVKVAQHSFTRGVITGLELGLIAYKNNNHAF